MLFDGFALLTMELCECCVFPNETGGLGPILK